MADQIHLAAEWLREAESDRDMAERAFTGGKPLPGMAAYHFQQSAEKLLKALLTYHGRVFEKTHDLASLCKLCVDIAPQFGAMIDRVDRLTDYAVDARYPGVEKPTAADVEEARAIVDEVRQVISFSLKDALRVAGIM